ncbi:hypothetical protein Tco_0222329 [Tanacetum coccineum]
MGNLHGINDVIKVTLFISSWGLTDSCRMDNSPLLRDMMSNLFTPVDHEFFDEGDHNAALIREKGLQERVEELEKEEAETKELWVDREKFMIEYGNGDMVFSLAVGKGFMDGISIGRKDEDIKAILAATPNVDHASYDIFMVTYKKLFDKRYPYVDKVDVHTS